jgi:hypothetical protein
MSVVPQSAYPTAEQVMNRARAYANDAFRQGKGRILTDTAPFTIEYLNGALEELQDKLGNNGVISLTTDNIILGPIGPLPGPDPAVQIFVGYTGYFDGYAMHALPALPSNLISVKEVWERLVGSGLPFKQMGEPQGPLPSILQGPWLNQWEYRQDAIYMTGSTQTEELRIRGEIRLGTLTDANDLATTQIGVLASVNALATLVAYNYARARGAPAAQIMAADALKFQKYIVKRYTRLKQEINYQRQPHGDAGDRRTIWLPF